MLLAKPKLARILVLYYQPYYCTVIAIVNYVHKTFIVYSADLEYIPKINFGMFYLVLNGEEQFGLGPML
jgi:hypothetical protein